MTDIEKFIDCYKQFGIDLILNYNDDIITIRLEEGYCNEGFSTHSDKFEGYGCFFTEITFTKEGKFIIQGFWE